jgi:tetratricopeptide (TPR) repeat protein
LIVLASCGPYGRHAASPGDALAGLPPHQDPPIALDDDDDLGRARMTYDALPLDDPHRSEQRRALWKAYAARIDAFLAADSRDDAFTQFQSALEMWDPSELQAYDQAGLQAAGLKPGPDLDLVAPTAQIIYDKFAPTGGDVQAVTALLPLIAAHPEKAADNEKLYADIASYSDDLAVSDKGEGARRLRPIQLLEDATKHFPLPWACEQLIKLYLDRQQALVDAVANKTADEGSLAVHGAGILMPVFNIIRAHARMGRLHEAPDVVDKLAGQTADEPELRAALRAALAADAPGTAWETLGQHLIDPRRFANPEDMDWQLIERVESVAVHRNPKSLKPRQWVMEAVQHQGKIRLLQRLLEDYANLDPKDHDVANTLSEVYQLELGDELISERLDAARADLAKLEAFIARAQTDPKKPIEPGMTVAWLRMASGLYQQGEIDEAVGYLKKVLADKNAKPLERAGATETIANIAMKRGQYAAAARDYAAAAAFPRESPLSQLIDRANLRRLAGEAYLAGGDVNQAGALFQAALDEWQQVLRAKVTLPQHAAAIIEQARVLWDMGKKDEAVRGMMDAAGTAKENPGQLSDILSFLVQRGYLEQATDVYHMVIVADASEYLHIYPSVWIVSLARMKGAPPDRQAVDFLAARSGTRWYHDLSRYMSGKLSFDELYKKANTRGKRAEAWFYEALSRYAAKDAATGQKDLRRVVSTEMFGFYEFDMAVYMLANGPPQ